MTGAEKAGLITFMIGLTGILGGIIRNLDGSVQVIDIIIWLSCVIMGAVAFGYGGSGKE